jgi:hypothetical protein
VDPQPAQLDGALETRTIFDGRAATAQKWQVDLFDMDAAGARRRPDR